MTKGLNPMDIIAQNKRLFSFNDRQLQIRRCLYRANKIYRWPFSAGDRPIRRTVNSADAELRVLFLGFCFSSLRSRIFDKSAYFPAFPAFIGQEYMFSRKTLCAPKRRYSFPFFAGQPHVSADKKRDMPAFTFTRSFAPLPCSRNNV